MLAGDVAFDCFLGQPISGKSRKSKSAAESLPSRYNNASQFARAAALATMFLLTTCHMACVYSTEARGYALAGAAAVFSTWILRQIVVDAKTGTVRFHLILVYFGLSAIGFLSHLSYATIYLPQIVWSVTLLFLRRCYSPIIGCHLPVFLLLAGLWLFDLQYAKVGGAPRQSAFWVGIEALALPTGAAYPDGLVLLCAAATLVGFSIGLVYVFQRSPTDAWLWGLMLFCSPPLMLAMRSDGLIHARHFLVVWMTLFPMLGIGLVQIVSRSRNLVSVPVVLVLVCWLATNGWEFSRFATYGRGGFHRSAEWIVAEALKTNAGVNQPQTIGSDHDFRNSLVLSYYMPRIPNNECLTYVKQGMWPAEGVDWVFVHKIDRNFIPPPEQQIGAWRYELAHYEPFAAPIGWHWAIYRRMK